MFTYNWPTFETPWVSLGVKDRHKRAAPGKSLALLLFPVRKTFDAQTQPNNANMLYRSDHL